VRSGLGVVRHRFTAGSSPDFSAGFSHAHGFQVLYILVRGVLPMKLKPELVETQELVEKSA
jgi:hypothetical protein